MTTLKIFAFITLLIFSSINLHAKSFSKEALKESVLVQKGDEKHWCPVCGMNLKMFYATNYTAKLKNKTPRQYCSMRCLVVDKEEYGIEASSIKAVDASTQKIIDAKSAYYVLGSRVKGTMSKTSKLAFSSESQAKEFTKEYGGNIVSFEEAIKSAKETLFHDNENIKKKKIKKIYPMGEKIFEKKCNKDIDVNNYIEINELKADIQHNKLCKPLKEGHLQALALYLWEVKRFGDLDDIKGKIHVTHDEKCPVCGMFVYKYPKWAAQIHYGDMHYSFDGVKDLMKYYFVHKKGISKILVTDYYSQKAIEARESYFVLGSDVYGPMGDELIPFEKLSDAKTFSMDHKGVKVLKFEALNADEVDKLDE
ncbi:nitrous oxide reductase accessory protein NosL [Sulfurimonas sp.]|uniref:nitrous oxide reductase accessory protein NosL n=1 Tax=Sulfurimonas sp. TaxID=2022749 RepID=UPI003569FAA2